MKPRTGRKKIFIRGADKQQYHPVIDGFVCACGCRPYSLRIDGLAGILYVLSTIMKIDIEDLLWTKNVSAFDEFWQKFSFRLMHNFVFLLILLRYLPLFLSFEKFKFFQCFSQPVYISYKVLEKQPQICSDSPSMIVILTPFYTSSTLVFSFSGPSGVLGFFFYAMSSFPLAHCARGVFLCILALDTPMHSCSSIYLHQAGCFLFKWTCTNK